MISSRQNISIISKVYVWSIVLEPLLFFIMLIPGTSNSVSNISRAFQIIVIVMLALNNLTRLESVKVPNIFSPSNKVYFYYFFMAILSGTYGYAIGAYDDIGKDTPVFRTYFEYFIALYYFVYFVIFPRILLSNTSELGYFFKVFSTVFWFSFIVGVLELVLFWLGADYGRIPRHLYDIRSVGFRFHGLAGEPRDAFVYLMLGLAILALKDIWRNEKKLSIFRITLILLAALMTQSASGLIGLVFTSILIMLYFIPKLPTNKIIPVIFLLIIILGVVILVAINSPRIMVYFEAFLKLYPVLESGREVTSILQVTMNNIYPIWHRWMEVLEFNFLPLILGSGYGSASMLNNNYLTSSNGIVNPNANIIRTIYENGLIGTLLFIGAFLVPIKRIVFINKMRLKINVLTLLLLGVSFAQRTVAPFVFLGITLLVFRYKYIMIQNRQTQSYSADMKNV